MATTTYSVSGMTCSHCELSVREEVTEVGGVIDVKVSAKSGVLNVTSDGAIDDAAILAAVEEAGYSAVRA